MGSEVTSKQLLWRKPHLLFLGCPLGSSSPNSMLRVLLSAQASPARLSGLLLIPPGQPCSLGPSKWGHRPLGGGPQAGPVQGLQRLLEQARSPGELLRWLGQNPTKVRACHYPVALRRLGQLLESQPRPPPVEQTTLQDLSQLIIRNCPSFDIHTIHVCLHLAVLLGEEGLEGAREKGAVFLQRRGLKWRTGARMTHCEEVHLQLPFPCPWRT